MRREKWVNLGYEVSYEFVVSLDLMIPFLATTPLLQERRCHMRSLQTEATRWRLQQSQYHELNPTSLAAAVDGVSTSATV